MRIAVLVAVVVVAAQLTGCNFNPPPDSPGDGPERCTASGGDCVCKLPEGFCVECTVDDTRNCTVDSPVCGADNQCRGCRADSECTSNVCLETGSCANPAEVLYVTPSGNATADCGTPGNECSLGQAMQLVSTGATTKNIIRLAPSTYNFTFADGLDITRSLTLVARMSTFRRTAGTGPLVTVRAGITFKLIGPSLIGPTGSDGIRCDNATLGVHETVIEGMQESAFEGNSCGLTIARSTLRENLGGGINMIGDPKVATITNNFIYNNGQNTSTIGGMVLKLAGGSRIEFNTVVDNIVTSTGGAGGIQCDGSYDAKYNLIFRNQGGIGGMVQVVGTCTFLSSSYVQAAASGDNSVGFADPDNPTSPDFHLTDRSPVGIILDAVDCTGVDFELDPRPLGTRCDHGADEHRPTL